MPTTAVRCKCGEWFNERAENPHGMCKTCRHRKATVKPRKTRRTAERGWGVDAEGKRHCYDCCQARDLQRMQKTGRIGAYLSSDGRYITG